MTKKLEIFAQSEDKGKRLDKFLFEKIAENIAGFSRTRVKTLVDNGDIVGASNNSNLNCSAKIKGDEKFLVTIPENEESKIEAQDIDFEIVFEDDDMLVINKPAGLTTHPGTGNQDNTLVNALLFKIGDRLSGINGVTRPGIVHRLDKDTSGLMVVAKNDVSHQSLAAQIESRELKRSYLALCYGVPEKLSGRIDKNIARSHRNRLKMTIVKNSGKHAITNYTVVKTYCNNLLSLVECRLETGRTHQIRVHMKEIGHALVGDLIYNNKRKYLGTLSLELQNAVNNFPRQFLHSYKIGFAHPISGEEMEFEIPLAKDLQDLLDLISQN